jgi:tetratricopeptide (TPR) repeat protein
MAKLTRKNNGAVFKTKVAVEASLLMKKKYTYLIVIFLIIASCAAFGRIAGNDFVDLDDTGYITENSQIKSGINLQTIKWAFNAFVLSNWHPLTLLSHTLDWSLFGANASGHHLVSLLLHIGAVIFLFLFLNKTTNNLWPAAFAAALFALHPLRVESVAWAAERKDVLSMFFGMAALYAYAFYAESAKLSRYFLCLILFAFSLMSKPMLVTLPFVLFLLDYWPLGRLQKALSSPAEKRPYSAGRLIWEKTPFFLLTIASSVITYWAQNKGGAVYSAEILPFAPRVANAIVSYVAYLEKTFWPVNLAVFYPYEFSLPLWKILIPGIILIMITSAALYYFKKLPFLFVGWFWYWGTLIPVIGLVQVGEQAMADRYTYFPSIGIAVMLAWGIPLLFFRENLRKKILFPAGIIVLVILTILTWKQCSYWKNGITLFNHALRVTKDNYQTHNLRGGAYNNLRQYQLAIEDYNQAIRLKPYSAILYTNRGGGYENLNQHQRAIEDFNQAIRLKPDYADAYYYRGVVYAKLRQYQRAIEEFNQAIILKPDDADVYGNRGIAYGMLGNNNLGCRDVQKACELGNCKLWEAANARGLCR